MWIGWRGLRVAAAPLDLLEGLLARGDLVYALLLFHGSHYRDVVAAAARAGARLLGKIPFRLAVEAAADAARRLRGCSCASLVSHGALTPDAVRVSQLVEALTGLPTYPGEARGCCRLYLAALTGGYCSGSRGCTEAVVAEEYMDSLVSDIAAKTSKTHSIP